MPTRFPARRDDPVKGHDHGHHRTRTQCGQPCAAHCRRYLAGLKLPLRFKFGELPETFTGQIQKAVLSEKIKAVHAIDV